MLYLEFRIKRLICVFVQLLGEGVRPGSIEVTLEGTEEELIADENEVNENGLVLETFGTFSRNYQQIKGVALSKNY